ncbi:hypothetical protein LCGC14_0498720 [marine sediment metagenome]|uniref:Uncharacterized protein n=1 Tax=marine sediment metagenome TaxID=412755 RepID=A0A0F9VDC3_9ZZZZ
MAEKRIKTTWDEEIAELEEIKGIAFSAMELAHPEGLKALSFLAEGYRRGVLAERERTSGVVEIARLLRMNHEGILSGYFKEQTESLLNRLDAALAGLEEGG